MADTYAILGVSDSEPVLLHHTESCDDAAQWIKGYTKQGDYGGYDAIALYEVGQEQDASTVHLYDCPIDIWQATSD